MNLYGYFSNREYSIMLSSIHSGITYTFLISILIDLLFTESLLEKIGELAIVGNFVSFLKCVLFSSILSIVFGKVLRLLVRNMHALIDYAINGKL